MLKPEELASFAQQTVGIYGTIDVLISSANYQADLQPLLDQTEEEPEMARTSDCSLTGG